MAAENERLCKVLAELKEARGGALALVSGRSVRQLFSLPRLSAAGLPASSAAKLCSKVARANPDPKVEQPCRRLSAPIDTRVCSWGRGSDARLALLQGTRASGRHRSRGRSGGRRLRGRPRAAGRQNGNRTETSWLRQRAGDRRVHARASVRWPAGRLRWPTRPALGVVNDLGGTTIRIGLEDRPTAAV